MSTLVNDNAIEEIGIEKGRWQEWTLELGRPLKKIIDFVSGTN